MLSHKLSFIVPRTKLRFVNYPLFSFATLPIWINFDFNGCKLHWVSLWAAGVGGGRMRLIADCDGYFLVNWKFATINLIYRSANGRVAAADLCDWCAHPRGLWGSRALVAKIRAPVRWRAYWWTHALHGTHSSTARTLLTAAPPADRRRRQHPHFLSQHKHGQYGGLVEPPGSRLCFACHASQRHLFVIANSLNEFFILCALF